MWLALVLLGDSCLKIGFLQLFAYSENRKHTLPEEGSLSRRMDASATYCRCLLKRLKSSSAFDYRSVAGGYALVTYVRHSTCVGFTL